MALSTTTQEQLWKRLRAARPIATVGLSVPDPPASMGYLVARIRCDVPQTTLGPLADARAKIEHLLGGAMPLIDQARDRVVSGLRRRLLGDEPLRAEGAELVDLANRLALEIDGRGVLLFEAVEAADPATIEALRALVTHPGWLKLPLVLAFRTEPTGIAQSLLEAVRTTEGPDAVLREEPEPEAPREEPKPTVAFELRALPHDVLRILRAGATIGTGFELSLVAELVGQDELDVLDGLQRAKDLGVPIEDAGEDRFHLPEPIISALAQSTLPSLANAWHRMLASMLETQEQEPEPDPAPIAAPPKEPEPKPEPAAIQEPSTQAPTETAAAVDSSADSASIAEPAQEAAEAAVEPEPAPTPPTAPYADLFGQSAAEPAQEPTQEPAQAEPNDDPPADAMAAEEQAEAEAVPPQGSWVTAPEPAISWFSASNPAEQPKAQEPAAAKPEPERLDKPEPSRGATSYAPRGDDARAAGHLAAAGEIEASIEKYRAAAAKAAQAGAFQQALAHGSRALALAGSLPRSKDRRRMQATLLVELGRLQWQAAGPDPAFTLPRALKVLEQAREALGNDDLPELRTQIATLIASICYDLGDMRSLERAEAELSQESRALLEAGDAVGAARLLNDQAAVYVRMGDPVRAVHLLTESRRVFEERAPTDPIAQIELAETDHLLARIPLHVPPRPGREIDAIDMGLDHAIAAERTYKRMGAARELGRVWETMGRLELKKGRIERAVERLRASLEVGQKTGDIVGLARSAAAMSEVLAAAGRYREALALLGDSIALNLEKGSLFGLALNRRSFEDLARRAPKDGATQSVLRAVAERLRAAESVLPRITLPDAR